MPRPDSTVRALAAAGLAAQSKDGRTRALVEEMRKPATDADRHLSGDNDNARRSRPEMKVGHVEQRPTQPRPRNKANNSGGTSMPMSRIRVALHGSDVISRAGVTSQLRPRPEVLILGEAEADEAEVAVVVADGVDEPTLRILRALHGRGNNTIVVVAAQVDDAGLLAAVEHGVAGIVRRSEASPDRLVTAICAAVDGEGSVPPDLLGRLLKQVGTVQREVLGPRGLSFSGLSDREIEVLRLIADGYDTSEAAVKLSYSPRTIKNILHDVTNRFCLRNRCHAVAYALRNGLI